MTEGPEKSAPEIGTAEDSQSERKSRTGLVKKLLLLSGLAGVFAFISFQYGEYLSLETLASKEDSLLDQGRAHPVLIALVAFLVYVVITGLSLPGASAMTLAIGWSFHLLYGDVAGFLLAMLVVSFASTGGASLAFLVSRYLLRESIQSKFGNYLTKFNDALEREGGFYLFTLRLIPAVPFFVINVVMGLTKMSVWTFWWVSQVGMLPGTVVFVYTGWAVPSLGELVKAIDKKGFVGAVLTPQIIAAFVILGLFPLTVKKIMGAVRKKERGSEKAEGG